MKYIFTSILILSYFIGFTQNDSCQYYIDKISRRKIYTKTDTLPILKKSNFNKKYSEFDKNSISENRIDKIHEKGIIYVSFIIEVNGTISNCKIDSLTNSKLDTTSAIKIIKKRMSTWKPGYCNKKPVPFKTIAPVKFDY